MATAKKLYGTMHIEAEGCIVNVREGLTDQYGRRVTSIQILPESRGAGSSWARRGPANVRVVQLKGRKQKK